MPEPNLTISINGVSYDASEWQTVQQGRRLTEEWTDGWAGGAGEYNRRSRNRYYMASGIDPTLGGVLRLPPTRAASITLSQTTAGNPTFMAQETSTNNFVYFLSGRYSHKINIGTNAVIETRDHAANTVLGRPAFFEGKWYFPLGDTNVAKELTTITAASTDTYTSFTGVNALHFASELVKDGSAQLARASGVNNISFATSISTHVLSEWSGNFEAGDSGEAIVDLLSWLGQLAVFKPSGPYRFDVDGNTFPIQDFVAGRRSSTAQTTFVNYVLGPYLYWVHDTGLWRFDGPRGKPIGLETDPEWYQRISLDGFQIGLQSQSYTSCAAYGRWFYTLVGTHLMGGYLRDDGTPVWHGSLLETTADAVVHISDIGGTPVLWLVYGTKADRYDLEDDGSLRVVSLTAGRGDISTTYRFFLPQTDFGHPDKTKQLRRIWVRVRDWNTQAALSTRVHRDGNITSEAVGADYSTTGTQIVTFERGWTAGTNDTAVTAMLQLRITTTGSYAPSGNDPTILACGMEAATPTVYRVVIPVTREGLRETGQSINTVINALRDLRNATSISVIEPAQGGPQDTFTGYIIGHDEQAMTGGGHGEGMGYAFTLYIERWDF